MTQANFKFMSEATGGDQFSVVSFTGHEAISTLYEYNIEIRAPLSTTISLDDILDSPARFVTELDGKEYPVNGILSHFEELQTVQDYVHFKAVLVPRLWILSIYKTNEIYTQEKTVDQIIETVLENAGLTSDTDYDMTGLIKNHLLSRDYVCQFGESDFDFISRLLENEGIFYYFDQSSGDTEKIIFINDMNYELITRPGLTFDVTPSTSKQYDCIDAWSCRKQRLAGGVTVRDFNPDHPSMDIAGTTSIDQMGRGTDYSYGDNILDADEATYLSEIRAEERLCKKTRYYGEGSVTRLQAGYLFEMSMHPNENYNGIEYLAVEVNHEGQNLDMQMTSGGAQAAPQYRNSFVAIEAAEQFRPARLTLKPRFYGTMTAFVYAEAASGVSAEVDEQGRYRVHLPFDRAEGTKDSSDPDRKASTWIRMAQPYAGENEGMCFPLKGGTEVLLTFINGDPDRPIISAALANASEPALLNDQNAHVAKINTLGGLSIKAKAGSYVFKSSPVFLAADQASASWQLPTTPQDIYDFVSVKLGLSRVNQNGPSTAYDAQDLFFGEPLPSCTSNYPFTKLNDYGQADMSGGIVNTYMTLEEEENGGDNIARSTGPTYDHTSGSAFPYPEQNRVYFCGPFHEDFHMDDMGISGYKRERDAVTGLIDPAQDPVIKTSSDTGGPYPEIFHFPVPGGDADQSNVDNFPKQRLRGVSEDKRWGDQMNYAWGRSFNWGAGPAMNGSGAYGAGNSFAEYNYGNGYTENLITETGGTSEDTGFALKNHKDKIIYDGVNGWSPADDVWGSSSGWAGLTAKAVGWAQGKLEWATDLAEVAIDEGSINIPDAIEAGLAGTPWSGLVSKAVATSELKTARRLFPGDTAVEKTFGNTYSYQAGLAVDIHEGHSIGRTYGDSEEIVTGDSNSVIHGDSYETVVGHTNSFSLGNTSGILIGGQEEITLGEEFEFHGALKQEISLAAMFEFLLGIKTEIFLGGEFGFQNAFTLKGTKGIEIDYNSALRTFSSIAEFKKAQAEIKANKILMKKTSAAIESGELSIRQNSFVSEG